MANKVTTHTKIISIRSELKTSYSTLKNVFRQMTTDTYLTQATPRLTLLALEITKVFNSAENNLVDAHKAANALGEIKTNPKASKASYGSASLNAPKEIKVKIEEARINISELDKSINQLEAIKKSIQKAHNEMDGLVVTEQLVSSLDVIDYFYPLLGAAKAVKILTVKNYCTKNLRDAKSDVTKIINSLKTIKKTVSNSIERFAACENAVKRRSYDEVFMTTSLITEKSETPKSEIKKQITKLEEKQKEYVALYGEKSKEIEEEIARLKKLYGTDAINLQPNMGNYSMDQHNYGAFTIPYGYNAGCCATAYAIGLSITRGKPYNPTSFWNQREGLTYYNAGGIGEYKSGFNANAVYEALKNGKPTMFHYKYTDKRGNNNQHWVVITGIREGADPDNLTHRDFMAIDPGSGTLKSLADIQDSNKVFNICGTKTFT